MTTGVIATIPRYQFSSSTGVPLALGTLTVYLANTTTPTDTWQDSALSTLNTNPVQLDSSGSCVLWLDSTKSYKFILKNAAGATQWTQDNVSGAASVASLTGIFTKFTDLAASSGSSLVGYLPAGTGAVATTVQAKLRESVSVLDFGADPTGVADSTAAIQAAINYAMGTLGSGVNFPVQHTVKVVIPAGDYKITSGLVANRRVWITGDGMWATRLICTTSGTTFYGLSLRPDGAGGSPIWGAILENFQIVGNGGTTRCSGISTGSTAPYTISQSVYQNLVMYNVVTGLSVGDGIDNSFYNNRFFNIKVTGTGVTGVTTYGMYLNACVYNTFEGIEVTCTSSTAYSFYGTGGWNTFKQLACDGPSFLNIPNSTINTFTVEGLIAATLVAGTLLNVNGAKELTNITFIDCPNSKANYGLIVYGSGCSVNGLNINTTTGNSADKPNYPFAPDTGTSGSINGFYSTFTPTFTFEQTIALTTLKNWLISSCEQISINNYRTQLKLSAAPTTGTYLVGDRVVNYPPIVGQPKAWVCTVAGTPGTWVSEGNL